MIRLSVVGFFLLVATVCQTLELSNSAGIDNTDFNLKRNFHKLDMERGELKSKVDGTMLERASEKASENVIFDSEWNAFLREADLKLNGDLEIPRVSMSSIRGLDEKKLGKEFDAEWANFLNGDGAELDGEEQNSVEVAFNEAYDDFLHKEGAVLASKSDRQAYAEPFADLKSFEPSELSLGSQRLSATEDSSDIDPLIVEEWDAFLEEGDNSVLILKELRPGLENDSIRKLRIGKGSSRGGKRGKNRNKNRPFRDAMREGLRSGVRTGVDEGIKGKFMNQGS